jgi:hypothetical protein
MPGGSRASLNMVVKKKIPVTVGKNSSHPAHNQNIDEAVMLV